MLRVLRRSTAASYGGKRTELMRMLLLLAIVIGSLSMISTAVILSLLISSARRERHEPDAELASWIRRFNEGQREEPGESSAPATQEPSIATKGVLDWPPA